MSNCTHAWLCEDQKIDWCELCHAEREHADFCETGSCEACCFHGDSVECGFCIDCGKYIGYRGIDY